MKSRRSYIKDLHCAKCGGYPECPGVDKKIYAEALNSLKVTTPPQSDWENNISLFFSDLLDEADCGYCETSHDHDESRKELKDRAVGFVSSLLTKAVEEEREHKNQAYWERGQMVAYLSRILPSHLKVDPDEPEWPIVCVHSPAGQMTWHIPQEEGKYYDHLNVKPDPFKDCVWDGHTTEEKYQRLAQLPMAVTSSTHQK